MFDPSLTSEPLADARNRAMHERRPLRILFVCTGNICRSPLAHAVFVHKVLENGTAKAFEVESAGTHGYHIGENADQRMRKTAAAHGVNLDHKARKLTVADLDYYDLILAMDAGHLSFIRNLAGNRQSGVMLYRDFDLGTEKGKDVPDPYYDDMAAFETVYRIVDRCSDALIRAVSQSTIHNAD